MSEGHSPLPGFRAVGEPEVVLAFLRGELDSPRFGERVRAGLAQASEPNGDLGGLHLVTRPDLTSDEENRARERALAAARGWRDARLFEGFPERVDWFHGPLPPDVLARILFINYSYWNELTGGTRRPASVRATLESGNLPGWLTELGTDWCFELAAQLATAETVGDIIVMATPSLDRMVLLEGHARLSAVFVGGHERRLTVNAYVGMSSAVTRWSCF